MSSFPSRLALEEISLFVCPSPGGCILASNLCLTTHPLNPSLHLHLHNMSGLLISSQHQIVLLRLHHRLPHLSTSHTREKFAAHALRVEEKSKSTHISDTPASRLDAGGLASHRSPPRMGGLHPNRSVYTHFLHYLPSHTTLAPLGFQRSLGDDENLFHIRSFHSSRRHEPI